MPGPAVETGLRVLAARASSITEDAVYVGVGVLLAFSAVALLISAGVSLWSTTMRGAALEAVIGLLDRTLLVLMLVELLYTVRVSFRQHALLPEPFLIVGLIAATRRILVVTAEFSVKGEANPEKFAQEWAAEYANGYPRLEALRRKRNMMSLWALEQQVLELLRQFPPESE